MILSGCSSLSGPKMDTCLLNMKTRFFECKDSNGIRKDISMITDSELDETYMHNQVSLPYDQFIKLVSRYKKAKVECQ